MGIARRVLLRGSESRWLAEQLTRRRFVRRAVTRFMPGETIDEALTAAEALSGRKITSILTLLGENVEDAGAADLVVRDYIDLLARLAGEDLDGYISVKPTHLGLDHGFDVALNNLESLAIAAGRSGRMMAVDMESTVYVEPTLDLYSPFGSRERGTVPAVVSVSHRGGPRGAPGPGADDPAREGRLQGATRIGLRQET